MNLEELELLFFEVKQTVFLGENHFLKTKNPAEAPAVPAVAGTKTVTENPMESKLAPKAGSLGSLSGFTWFRLWGQGVGLGFGLGFR